MRFAFRKDVYFMLLWGAIIFYIAAPMYACQTFIPKFLGKDSIPYFMFAIYCLMEGSVLLSLALRLHKTDPQKMCKRIAAYEFAVNPIFALSALFLSAIIPPALKNWIFFSNFIVTVLLFAIRITILSRMNRIMKEGLGGYIGIRNHSWIGASFMAIVFNFYLFGTIKSKGLDINEIVTEKFGALTELFNIITLLQVAIGILILFQSLFITISTYYSFKENETFDFKTNLEKSKEMFRKYDVAFWISIFSTFILWILAMVSAIRMFKTYFSLAFLYSAILIIRLPTFVRKKIIRKHYHNDSYKFFTKEHMMFIYCAILLIAYAVVCVIFGNESFSKIDYGNKNELITLGIFIPWAIIKLILSSKGYAYARKTGDPFVLMNVYIDVLVAIYTIAKTMFIFANITKFQGVRITGIVIGTSATVYCFVISLKMMIVGILGLSGKRENYFLKHKDIFELTNISLNSSEIAITKEKPAAS